MREIKFRAWDKKVGKMVLTNVSAFTNEYHLAWWPSCKTPFPALYRNSVVQKTEDYEIMQYTGLKDKNDKEIYEGDILATSEKDPHYDTWRKKDFGYTVVEWSEEYSWWTGSKWKWVPVNDDTSVYSLRFVEIIGNIWENPELLKEGR
jgi:uncharacterized phage protein (TIGR01671 family)